MRCTVKGISIRIGHGKRNMAERVPRQGAELSTQLSSPAWNTFPWQILNYSKSIETAFPFPDLSGSSGSFLTQHGFCNTLEVAFKQCLISCQLQVEDRAGVPGAIAYIPPVLVSKQVERRYQTTPYTLVL